MLSLLKKQCIELHPNRVYIFAAKNNKYIISIYFLYLNLYMIYRLYIYFNQPKRCIMENCECFAIFFYKFLQLESRQVMDTCVNLHDTKPNLGSDIGNNRDGSKFKTFTQQTQRMKTTQPRFFCSYVNCF